MINKKEIKFNRLHFYAKIYNAIESCTWLSNYLEDYLTDDELQLEIENLAFNLREKLEIIEKELNETSTI